MRGIIELSFALGVSHEEALRVLKAVYGLSNAPLTFYKYFKQKTEKKVGGRGIVGFPCTWTWRGKAGKVIGWTSVHVDDVIMGGHHDNPERL